jgi:methyl-accepting chemotaxis protein
MENLKATLEDIVEELEVGLQESLEGNLESEVSDVNETFKSTVDLPMHLQKEFTSSIIDFPNKNSSDALSSRGAYNYIPHQLEINKVSENSFKFNFLSRSGDIVGNEVNFQFTKLTEETTPQKLEVAKLNNTTYKLYLRNFKGEILGAVQYIKLPEVVDTIEKGNFNAVTSNKVYDLKETLINNLQEINTYLSEIKKSIPTKVGQLENDSNFMSNLEVINFLSNEKYITLSKLNSFNFADKNYIQEIITNINGNIQDINSRISNLISEDTKTNSRIDKNINTIQELSSKINKLNSNLNSLQIPTKVSQLNNDSGFITKNYVDSILGDINNKLDLINGEVI